MYPIVAHWTQFASIHELDQLCWFEELNLKERVEILSQKIVSKIIVSTWCGATDFLIKKSDMKLLFQQKWLPLAPQTGMGAWSYVSETDCGLK